MSRDQIFNLYIELLFQDRIFDLQIEFNVLDAFLLNQFV